MHITARFLCLESEPHCFEVAVLRDLGSYFDVGGALRSLQLPVVYASCSATCGHMHIHSVLTCFSGGIVLIFHLVFCIQAASALCWQLTAWLFPRCHLSNMTCMPYAGPHAACMFFLHVQEPRRTDG
jgi:hypothetical protein